MSFSAEDMKSLRADIDAIPEKKEVFTKPTMLALAGLIDNLGQSNHPSDDLLFFIRHWVSRVQVHENITKINASELTISRITEIFHLTLDKQNVWTLASDNLPDVPIRLKRNFADLKEALYDEDSKATSQIAVDIMLVQCLKHIRQKYQSAKTAQNVAQDGPSTPLKAAVTTEPITLFPEASMSVNMPNPLMANGRVVITGRTDWVLGYDNIGDDVTQLIALEVKQRSEFSIGEAQLIAYLAILRENRIRARKLNTVTQGFYSDGKRFAFVRITSDGIIQMSKNFNIVRETNLRAVFHFIVDIMETAMKSTPNATPTKPGQLQEKEINQSKDDVWSKALALIEESIVVGSDDDMEDAIDLQRT